MKEQYSIPEIDVVKFSTEDTILMSNPTTGDNETDVGEVGSDDLG